MDFLTKRKQRKMRLLEGQIKEIGDKIEPFKDTTEYAKHSREKYAEKGSRKQKY